MKLHETTRAHGWMTAWALGAMALTAALAGCSEFTFGKPPVPAAGPSLAPTSREILFASTSAQGGDPFQAGQAAAEAAKAALRGTPVKAVLISECFEGKEAKAKALAGVCSVLPKHLVYGGSSYGTFNQSGAHVADSIGVLAIAGIDISVGSACQEDLGTSKLTPAEHEAEITSKLTAAGAALARKLPRSQTSRLMIVIADAHSPKNGPLVEGIQTVAGGQFPITGGCANKNAGQTFVYYQGRMLTDAAIGLMLSGPFRVALARRTARDNDRVIAAASESSAAALADLLKGGARPAVAIVFDCAGRKGKLNNVSDELAAIRKALGPHLPLFGSYNAGEIGPADRTATPDTLSSGVGWHVMVTLVGW